MVYAFWIRRNLTPCHIVIIVLFHYSNGASSNVVCVSASVCSTRRSMPFNVQNVCNTIITIRLHMCPVENSARRFLRHALQIELSLCLRRPVDVSAAAQIYAKHEPLPNEVLHWMVLVGVWKVYYSKRKLLYAFLTFFDPICTHFGWMFLMHTF